MPIPDGSSPYLAHIISQTKQNLHFLVSQSCLSPEDVQIITSKLDSIALPPALPNRSQQLALKGPNSSFSGPSSRARVLWGYNEDSRNPNDLSFRPGDIIEIVEETNPDWWQGRFNGRQGLFPSNHVQRLDARLPNSPPRFNSPSDPFPYQGNFPPMASPQFQPAPPNGYPGPQMQVPMYRPHPYVAPPPAATTLAPPPQQLPPSQPDNSSYKSELGHTLANAAVGGLGWGAGMAVGEDLINKLF